MGFRLAGKTLLTWSSQSSNMRGALMNYTLLTKSDHRCEDIMAIANVSQVFAGFGFNVYEVDGHNCDAITEAWQQASAGLSVILANTRKPGTPGPQHDVVGQSTAHDHHVCIWGLDLC